jgi:site-specific DNA-methyltransferase (adenine-specific)
MAENKLFHGDNLPILRDYIEPESVDLVYLDPPFKSNQDYNVLFAAQDGTRAAAQIKAFEDTWTWDQAAVEAYNDIVERGGDVAEVMRGFARIVPESDMLAYLSMMAPRLVELHRVLKQTGSLYLHCDPTASHYLKLLLDAVFGPEHFRSEIIWRRTGAHGKAKRYSPIHDVILYYVKSRDAKWKYPKRPYMKGHVEEYFIKDENGWKTNYYGNVLTGSGLRGGESGKPWKGFDPSAKGRHWAIPGALLEEIEDAEELTQHERLDRLYEMGFITITEGEAWPMYERYLKPNDGQPVSDIWAYQPYTEGTVFDMSEGIDADVRWLSTRDAERLGYPTQKPESLLERIIRASSDRGDVVLDPFCGCGTTVAAAQKLDRRWLGMDITYLAIALIRARLETAYGTQAVYDVIREPTTLQDAQDLASNDPWQFQVWALSQVHAWPIGQQKKAKRGADQGIDGRLYFHLGDNKTREIILSVKAGHNIDVSMVRDLRGVIEREEADMGVLISMDKPTRPMRVEAAGAGTFKSQWGDHPRIQLLTIEDILDGKGIDYPRTAGINQTYKASPRAPEDSGALNLDIDLTPEARPQPVPGGRRRKRGGIPGIRRGKGR